MNHINNSRVEAMKISLIDDENRDILINLEKSESEYEIKWSYSDAQFEISIITDCEIREVKSMTKSDNLIESQDEIKQKFLDIAFENKMSQFINLEDGFDDAEDEENNEIEKINPYDSKLIRVDTKTFTVFQINQMINEEEVDLSPDFQRGFVWNDITRKSRLIESLLLRIPIPVFYLAQDEEGLFQVVDGVQRLTVINSFMNNEFRLKNLEYLEECNGKWFKNGEAKKEDNLDTIYTRRIEQTQLFINVIDPQTPGKVKYDIFKRINTGGKALNNQEIRNCLANIKTRNFLHELSKSESFLRATRGSVSPVRMADEELVLRFIAFYLIDNNKSTVKEYKGGMDGLLDETVELLNSMKIEDLKEVRTDFLVAMEGAFYLFGNNAFRKSIFINKALFLGISRVLSKFDISFIKEKNKGLISASMQEAIESNEKFRTALSMATNDARNVKIVYDTVSKIIGEE